MHSDSSRSALGRTALAGIAGAVLMLAAGGAAAQQQMGQGMMNQGCPGMIPGMTMRGNMGPGMMSGMMDDDMMGPGMMQGGMMGQGAMGQGMMGGGMMGQGMMGQGMMGPGMADGGFIMMPGRPALTTEDVTQNLERMLAARANPHLKLGKVADKDANTIVGEIVTTDGSLVERYEVDKRSWVAKLVP